MRLLKEQNDLVQGKEIAVLILFRESDLTACILLANAFKDTGRAVYGLVDAAFSGRDSLLREIKATGALADCIVAHGPCIAMGDALSAHARLLQVVGVRRVLTLSLWAGHRTLASELNAMEGLSDSSCHGLTLALDRWQMRRCLRQAHLSGLRTMRVVRECVLQRARQSGQRWMVKSRWVPSDYRSRLLQAHDSVRLLKGADSLVSFPHYDAPAGSLVLEQVVDGTPCVVYVIAHEGRMFSGRACGPSGQSGTFSLDAIWSAGDTRRYLEKRVVLAARALGLTQGAFRFDVMMKGPRDAEVLTVTPVGSDDLHNELDGLPISDIVPLLYLSQVDPACRVRLEHFLESWDGVRVPAAENLLRAPQREHNRSGSPSLCVP